MSISRAVSTGRVKSDAIWPSICGPVACHVIIGRIGRIGRIGGIGGIGGIGRSLHKRHYTRDTTHQAWGYCDPKHSLCDPRPPAASKGLAARGAGSQPFTRDQRPRMTDTVTAVTHGYGGV